MKRRRFVAGLVAAVLVLGPATAVLADEEQDAEEVGEVAQMLIEEVTALAEEADVDPDTVLEAEVDVEIGDEEEPVKVTVREALIKIAGRTYIDDESYTGLLGTPQLNAGNLLHVAADGWFEELPAGTRPADAPPPSQECAPVYDVVESGFTPETPLAPVPNPLLVAGPLLPEDVELPELPEEVGSTSILRQPLLAAHWGGRLKSITGGDWMLGTHSAGTQALGSNVDSEDRQPQDDPWPVWMPEVTGGMTEDSSIDFFGFALVVKGEVLTPLDVTLPVVGTFRLGYLCVAFGTILGDGVSTFDGAPFSFRELPLIWDEPPPPVDQVIEAVDGVLEMVPSTDDLPVPVPELPEM